MKSFTDYLEMLQEMGENNMEIEWKQIISITPAKTDTPYQYSIYTVMQKCGDQNSNTKKEEAASEATKIYEEIIKLSTDTEIIKKIREYIKKKKINGITLRENISSKLYNGEASNLEASLKNENSEFYKFWESLSKK